MADQSYFMGLDGFVWFVGVVEDRNDPDELGRVRVRCLGFHTENLTSLPTADLPWAHVMHPVTDPSMHGMGNSPSFLVEGSWVIGFFRDAQEKQQPVIIGTIPGNPKTVADNAKGFNDPRHKESTQLNDAGLKQYAAQTEKDGDTSNPTYGPYPLGALKETGEEDVFSRYSKHTYGESDTNRLARGETSETHGALISRRALKETDVPTATKPFLSKVQDGAEAETRGSWDELDPKGLSETASPYTSAEYPNNHVYESEAGHIFEVDDTKSGERLLRQHSSNTFEEIHPDGSKVVKVLGDNYEIIAGASNVYIGAAKGGTTDVLNLTINGNVRELVKGDYIQEIEGNFTQKIGKNHRVKVGYLTGGNREEEIRGNHAFEIDENVKGRVGGFVDTLIEGSETRSVNSFSKLAVESFYQLNSNDDIYLIAKENLSAQTTSGITSFKSGGKLNMKSAAAMQITSESTLTETITSNVVRTVGGTLSDTVTGVGTQTFSGVGSEMTAKNGSSVDISLTTHVHSQGADAAGDAEVNTNAPVA